MASLMIIRPIYPLRGRETDALSWLQETASVRGQAGQISQNVVRGVVDQSEYLFVQIWRSRAAYDDWRYAPERQRLAAERQRYLAHDPAKLYDILS